MISFIKKTVSIAAAAACMLTSLHFTYITEVKEADAASGMNAFEITREMKIGWNLGNSLDATGGNGYTGVRTEESCKIRIELHQITLVIKTAYMNTSSVIAGNTIIYSQFTV